MGLWWRWQDLNLRPWDYDSPAQNNRQNFILMRINRVNSMNQTLNLRTSKHQKTNFFEPTLNVSFFLKPLLTKGLKIWNYSHSIVAGGLEVISYRTLFIPLT